jgi:hypothetical protein
MTIGLTLISLFGTITLACTPSMVPTFDCNNTLYAHYLQPQERLNLSIGDIVLWSPTAKQRWLARQKGFWIKETWVIHRIINKTPNGYIIKGDNNEETDNEYVGIIRPYQVSYKIVKIV